MPSTKLLATSPALFGTDAGEGHLTITPIYIRQKIPGFGVGLG